MAQVEKNEKLDAKKTSVEDVDEVADKNSVKAVVETKAAREAREKAEWDRLSIVEKMVKKYLPSQINSIAIFVSNSITYFLPNKCCILGCSRCWVCYLRAIQK